MSAGTIQWTPCSYIYFEKFANEASDAANEHFVHLVWFLLLIKITDREIKSVMNAYIEIDASSLRIESRARSNGLRNSRSNLPTSPSSGNRDREQQFPGRSYILGQAYAASK